LTAVGDMYVGKTYVEGLQELKQNFSNQIIKEQVEGRERCGDYEERVGLNVQERRETKIA